MNIDDDFDLARRRHFLWNEIRRLADRIFVLTDAWMELDRDLYHREREALYARPRTRMPFETDPTPDDEL